MSEIYSAAGKKNGAKVDESLRLWMRGVSESGSLEATDNGDAYNINTGDIALTSSNDSAVLYYKHNEDSPLIVEAVAVGINKTGTVSDVSNITVVRNPTAGTIVSNALPVAMNQNRLFSSSNTLLNSIAYKGAEGYTFTGGEDIAQFYQSQGGRLFGTVNFELRKGNSIGIRVNTKTTGGTTNIYTALVTYLKYEG